MTAPSLFGDSVTQERTLTQSAEPTRHASASDSRSASTSSLYRKYRPQSFDGDELVGQDYVVRTLRNAISLDRVAHAYLFSGPRGTGKTTTARVLAKAINCLVDDPGQRPCQVCANCRAVNAGSSPDIIEIDAASNRGIDDIRDLRERVRYAPAQLRSKVYIIDEAHQITGAAANAFLKTLEEPPSHSRFILATTDPEELLPTIVSRCQRFEFRRVSVDDMTRRLQTVADLEGISIEMEALRMIARHATGSLRDALGLLERLSLGSGPVMNDDDPKAITVAEVTTALGMSRNDRIERLLEAISRRDPGEALRIVQDAVDNGEDPRQLNRQLLTYLRVLLFARSGGAAEADSRAHELAEAFSLGELATLARRFGEIDFSIKHAPFPQLPLEVALVESTESPVNELTRGPQVQERPDDEKLVPAPREMRPTSLRDRVRAPAVLRETSFAAVQAPTAPDPAPITPLRPEAPVESTPDMKSQPGPALGVEQIADLWPIIRADVKALNRRIEALLSEVDPVAISGSQITLAVPYPFHRDKLNSDEVRETVAGVISRLLDHPISLVCILRGEMTTRTPDQPATPEQVEPGPGHETVPDADEEERARIRIRAAMNIFDAEEITLAQGPNGPTQPAEN